MSKSKKVEQLKIVGLPKGSVMWPTAFAALVLGIIGSIDSSIVKSSSAIFFGVFAINLLILFFDFSRGAVVGMLGLAIAIITIVYTQEYSYPLDDLVSEGVVGGVSYQFLIVYGVIFLILLFFAILFRRTFDYFELTSNEIVRKHGILGDAERFNAPNLHIKKRIHDVFESILLFGAGELDIITSGGKEFHILNVPRINRVEKNIREILGRLDVELVDKERMAKDI